MKTAIATTIVAFALATSTAIADTQSGNGSAQQATQASGTFVNTDGEENGTATLTGTENGVLIELEVSGLPSDPWVALHIHENGECNPDDGFESAGDHFNPTDRDHGYLAADGPHFGDMPNQHVGSDGTLRAEVFNAMVRLDAGEADVGGRALVVHSGRDDYESQPSGDSGDPIACAPIE